MGEASPRERSNALILIRYQDGCSGCSGVCCVSEYLVVSQRPLPLRQGPAAHHDPYTLVERRARSRTALHGRRRQDTPALRQSANLPHEAGSRLRDRFVIDRYFAPRCLNGGAPVSRQQNTFSDCRAHRADQ